MTKMETHSESGNKTGTIAHYIHKDDESSTEIKPASSKRLTRKHTSYQEIRVSHMHTIYKRMMNLRPKSRLMSEGQKKKHTPDQGIRLELMIINIRG